MWRARPRKEVCDCWKRRRKLRVVFMVHRGSGVLGGSPGRESDEVWDCLGKLCTYLLGGGECARGLAVSAGASL